MSWCGPLRWFLPDGNHASAKTGSEQVIEDPRDRYDRAVPEGNLCLAGGAVAEQQAIGEGKHQTGGVHVELGCADQAGRADAGKACPGVATAMSDRSVEGGIDELKGGAKYDEMAAWCEQVSGAGGFSHASPSS